ncbi:hypothetical protein NTE_00074 [Candidatus Nitrososphaera evergladensis SR1]|uniref:Uncharacterized protein n=1 Tax=Candidatus Nitrososphaera evergladensis SR1 TaxID=1459636 RepID=A0A075MLK8_9ARCH|nr:hypothetical protein [Candidatus Nitrososphaera evergladensis]AIF82158.1 hypothetical protein NTE_00074 [Candidatus Nitrososphaera evergladensis SR1]
MSAAESSLDFDAYWRAWLASRLAEMREKAAARARQQQEEEQEQQEEGEF